MFDIGFSEIVVIGVVALVVFGPEDLPKVARIAGRMLGNFRRYVDQVKTELDQEIQASELKQLGQDIKESAQTLQASLNEQVHAAESEWQAATGEVGKVAQELAAPAGEITAAVREAAPTPVPPVASEEPVTMVPEVVPEPLPAAGEVVASAPAAKRKRVQAARAADEPAPAKVESEPVLAQPEPAPVAQANVSPVLVLETGTAPEAQSEPTTGTGEVPAEGAVEVAPAQEKNDDQLDLFGMPESSAIPHKA